MNTARIRPPAVAGMFYPGQRDALADSVTALLAQAKPANPASPATPKALIVPHAGYIYSGAVAASAYATIAPLRQRIRRVVLLGPAHRVALDGLALPQAEAFVTPLGSVGIDQNAAAQLLSLPQVSCSNAAHAEEHSLEVHLPFLQTILEDFQLAPLVVGNATAEEVAEVLEHLWGGPETLIVISSDLSHYLPYAAAQALDQRTAAHILAGEPLTEPNQACGALPIDGLLLCARRHGLSSQLLDLRKSGDSPAGRGDHSRVVGYGAFAFNEAASDVH